MRRITALALALTAATASGCVGTSGKVAGAGMAAAGVAIVVAAFSTDDGEPDLAVAAIGGSVTMISAMNLAIGRMIEEARANADADDD